MTAEFQKFYVVTVYTPNAKDDLQPSAGCDSSTGIRPSSPIASNWRRPSGHFLRDLNVAHTELDLANPKPNRGKKASRMKNVRDSRISWTRVFVDTFRLFTQGNGHYRGGATSPIRGRGISGENRLRSRVAAIARPVKAADPSHRHGSDHCPVSITLRCITPRRALARAAP